MKVATLSAALLLLTSSIFAQRFPVNTKVAFISILTAGKIDPRSSIGAPTGSLPGYLVFSFIYPDTCLMRHREYLRSQKDALHDFTRSFIGADSLKGYAFAEYAYFDKPYGLYTFEKWRAYFSPDDRDTFNTPKKRLDLLRKILPFTSAGEVTDTCVEIALYETPCFSPALPDSAVGTGYSSNGYLHILATVIHFYVLKGATKVIRIIYIGKNGIADISRFDKDVPYDYMLSHAIETAR